MGQTVPGAAKSVWRIGLRALATYSPSRDVLDRILLNRQTVKRVHRITGVCAAPSMDSFFIRRLSV